MSNLQLELLKLYARNVSESELIEIKELLARYFAEKAISKANRIWDEKKWTNDDADKIIHEHLRTPYKYKS